MLVFYVYVRTRYESLLACFTSYNQEANITPQSATVGKIPPPQQRSLRVRSHASTGVSASYLAYVVHSCCRAQTDQWFLYLVSLLLFFLLSVVWTHGLTGEIIRSELGGHDTPNLVSFKRRERLIGEPAVSMVTSTPKATIGAVHTMAGTPYR